MDWGRQLRVELFSLVFLLSVLIIVPAMTGSVTSTTELVIFAAGWTAVRAVSLGASIWWRQRHAAAS
jgi:hypothetical protein